MAKRFRDRAEAGQTLAQRLRPYANRPDVLVLALPRGGVPVAFEIANALQVPLDICLVRKLGVPEHPELAMGAIASDGVRVLNPEIIHSYAISTETVEAVTASEMQELQRRDRLYRGDRPRPLVQGKVIILVDDGLATGATMRAAIALLKEQHPAYLVVAVPIAPADTCAALRNEVDQVVCLLHPHPFYSLGIWYETFDQTSDAEVQHLLNNAASLA